MSDHKTVNYTLLSSKRSLLFSRKALALLMATLFLAAILAFSTYENINRARNMMEHFLVQKGETVIRSIEAGIRTTFMHHGNSNALHTLITESSRENDVVFISVINERGDVLYSTSKAPEISFQPKEIQQLLTTGEPITGIEEQTGIFTIYRKLELRTHLSVGMAMPTELSNENIEKTNILNSIILIGLLTKEYEEARRQDVHHAFFMGSLLFLIGSAGLYILFMYQSVRVANSTLANMRLYTENVIESIPVGLITLDVNENIVSCNSRMEDLFGKTFAEIRGCNLNDTFPRCWLDCADICNSVLDQDIECVAKEGKSIPIKVNGSSLVNDANEVIGTVLIIRDMSQIKDMELQLERSRRMVALGTMAAGIAHEIRNPLGTLRGFAHFFGSQSNADKESKRYSELMISEVDRLNENVSGLLQFSRPREPQKTLLSLDELLRKTSLLMEGDLASNKLTFHYQCNKNITFKADGDLLLQVILNLLKNSVAATRVDGELSLIGAQDNNDIRITIADSGIGMNEQECEKMFDPFFTTKKAGTGLGLAVSHQIVEQHNGKFEVVSHKGNGTTITIILPC